MMTDEEYEAELKARTPEQWAAMKEKSLADARDIEALRHLWWRRDVKDQESLIKWGEKPADMSLEDLDYFCQRIGEIADRLRAARDNPEERERRRWQDVAFCAAVIGSSEEGFTKLWLEQARDVFPATLGTIPPKDAPAIAHATYAIENLLYALLMHPDDRSELHGKMDTALMRWMGENGVRGGTYNAKGQFEMFGEVIPFKPGGNTPEADPRS
jgi:hypothetical protein